MMNHSVDGHCYYGKPFRPHGGLLVAHQPSVGGYMMKFSFRVYLVFGESIGSVRSGRSRLEWTSWTIPRYFYGVCCEGR